MSATKLPGLSTQHDPANTDDEDDHVPDPNSYIATLHRIVAGAGADGRPWPERNLSIGRSIELADADCALVSLRTVAEMALAGERARLNGASREGLGERSMEGLQMAVLALTVMATEGCRAAARCALSESEPFLRKGSDPTAIQSPSRAVLRTAPLSALVASRA
ncbi:hypothetical protein [Stenotrophomonas pavanii]|uniref:hypothetical protein n=1 Tax=Stenotrophomonas pavanii TaxID=487698 RepID=UPI0028AD4087|nr:hypothetical protein [Stenotrophomonas pavanii]